MKREEHFEEGSNMYSYIVFYLYKLPEGVLFAFLTLFFKWSWFWKIYGHVTAKAEPFWFLMKKKCFEWRWSCVRATPQPYRIFLALKFKVLEGLGLRVRVKEFRQLTVKCKQSWHFRSQQSSASRNKKSQSIKFLEKSQKNLDKIKSTWFLGPHRKALMEIHSLQLAKVWLPI